MAIYLLSEHQTIVQALLSAGADPNIQDSEGKTPLHLAAKRDNLPIAKLLIEHGANVDSRCGHWGFTPLYFAPSSELREYLKSQGAHTGTYFTSKIAFFARVLLKALGELG